MSHRCMYVRWKLENEAKLRRYWKLRRRFEAGRVASDSQWLPYDYHVWKFLYRTYDSCFLLLAEFCLAMELGFCCFMVPLMFVITLSRMLYRVTVELQAHGLRYVLECVLLFSMWHGSETKLVALLAWASWTLGLHCGSLLSCRTITWFVVCLAQQELRAWKLIFLTCLVYLAPLYGKRTTETKVVKGCSKKVKLAEAHVSVVQESDSKVNSSAAIVDERGKAAKQSLEIARSTMLGEAAPLSSVDANFDLRAEFPFVPELLLACLLSYYGTTVLRSALQEAWAPTLELWTEYRLDYEAAIEISPELEDDIISEYLRRFAHIYAEQMLETITDAERKIELQNGGRRIGPVRGDGNCLIASLLEGLVFETSLLPLEAVQNALTYDNLCGLCRAALVALPVGDVRKPMARC